MQANFYTKHRRNLYQHDNEQSVLPRLLFIDDLARITGLNLSTIRYYTGNAATCSHLLPKWFKLPGSRRLVWMESDVLDFIRNAHAQKSSPTPRRGRPTKAEQMRRSGSNQE